MVTNALFNDSVDGIDWAYSIGSGGAHLSFLSLDQPIPPSRLTALSQRCWQFRNHNLAEGNLIAHIVDLI